MPTLSEWRENRMMQVRTYTPSDWPELWQTLEPVFREGATYPSAPDISEEEAHKYWIESPQATYVAINEQGSLAGTYYIKPNQPPLGAHVCNCGYIVSGHAQGRGVGSILCVHSQEEAVRLGFRAMQYNLVVSANERAIHLWKKHGLQIVGTLPNAFRHKQLGYVDAFIMYKELV